MAFRPTALSGNLRDCASATQAGVPVPSLLSASPTRIVETYLSGTPLNRLDSTADQRRVSEAALVALTKLVASTQQSVPLMEYATFLWDESRGLLNPQARYDPNVRQLLEQSARDLHQRVLSGMASPAARRADALGDDPKITTAMTHGDFQPANILMDDHGATWVIDWENTGRRQAAYDFLVWQSDSRLAPGLAGRLRSSELREKLAGQAWTQVDWADPILRRCHLDLFLWEELNWHLRENANEHFLRSSPGLRRIVTEIRRWLTETAATP